MPVNRDEQPQSQPATAATREAEMRSMARMLARESRKSAIVGFFGGVIVVVGLGATYYAYLQTRSSLKTEIVKTDSLKTEVKTKSAEVSTAKQQAEITKDVMSATVANLQAASPSVATSTTAAINKAFEANPNASKLIARIYIHTHAADQRSVAVDMANALRTAGFMVPGIDVQPQTYQQTEIHYYAEDSQSLSDVAAITDALAKAGVSIRKRMVPPGQNDKLLSRAYGLWLAANLDSSRTAPPPPQNYN